MASKLTDKQRKKIIADYVDNGNYSETARINKVDEKTVRRIVKSDNDFPKKALEKKQQNAKDILDYMEETKDKRKKVIDLCLEKMEDRLKDSENIMNIRDIATAYGVLVDKSLKVSEMSSTGNNSSNNAPVIKLEVVDNSKLESVLYDNKE